MKHLETLLSFLALTLGPPLLGYILCPFLSRFDKWSKQRQAQADWDFFNRNPPKEPHQ